MINDIYIYMFYVLLYINDNNKKNNYICIYSKIRYISNTALLSFDIKFISLIAFITILTVAAFLTIRNTMLAYLVIS